MAVNLPRPPAAAESRLYLSEEALDRAVDLLFAATRRFWRAAEGPLAANELGPAHYRALAAIRRGEGATVSALIARLGVRKQSLARVLNELDGAGLILRLPGEKDRRERRLLLTDAGREAEAAASRALRDRLALVFRSAGAEAVAGARAVLALLAEVDGEDTRAP
jgi:DNA-binding MarR family transcriptional regulator